MRLSVALVLLAVLAGCLGPAREATPPADEAGPATGGEDEQTNPGSTAATATSHAPPPPPPADSDKDGASDAAERGNGTDPADPTDVPYALPPVPDVDAAALLADLGTFARTYNDRSGNGPKHLGARDWLEQSFASAGLAVWRQDFTREGMEQQNIAGIRWGLDPDAWVVVGAHYDTTTTAGVDKSASQGAYDDGSGTMMVVHLAKAFANLTLPYTIVFVAFDGEERGLQGSAAFLEDLQTGVSYPSAQLVGMVDIDMFGLNWPGTSAPMVFTTNSEPVLAAVEAARLARGVPDEGIAYDQGIALGSSDFGTFFDAGIATGFFMSDFERLGVPLGLVPASTPQGAYPFWHLSDTMETMTLMAGDEEHLRVGFQAGVALAADLVHYLASTPGPVEAGMTAV